MGRDAQTRLANNDTVADFPSLSVEAYHQEADGTPGMHFASNQWMGRLVLDQFSAVEACLNAGGR